jgi:hypothetical protein
MFSHRDSVVSIHICDYEHANNAISREQKVAVVEAYLDCFVMRLAGGSTS